MNLRMRLSEVQIAVMLLTRVPAGRIGGRAPTMAASAWAWPLAGILVGGIAAVVYAGATGLGLSPLIASLLALAAGVLATGGMHEDGLADLADGCGGGCDRANKLEIMRDSRIGTYGVLALLICVGLRTAAMAELATPALVVPALIALATASRAILPLWSMVLPSARPEGLGQRVSELDLPRVVVAALLGLAAVTLLPAGAWLPTLAAVLIGSAGIALIAWRHLGGQTGDVLGAAQQIAELSGWLVLSLL
ncbi:adenosylcobinamide-GDP ribazoletransferase [Actibacterium sp. D379-3]